jgi:thiol-disulfide isomerase/thioredoxin
MKLEKVILLFCLSLTLVQCKPERPEGFEITGRINANFKEPLVLRYENQKDTVQVKNGVFRFTGSVKRPTEAYFILTSPSSVQPFMIENSEIFISLKLEESEYNGVKMGMFSMDSISGSKSQALEESLLKTLEVDFHKQTDEDIRAKNLYDILYRFSKENPQSPIGGTYLSRMSDVYSYLNAQKIQEIYQLLDTAYQSERTKVTIKNLVGRGSLKEGVVPPAFTLSDLNNEQINSDSFRRKYVLLEFWASWCAPCRYQNPFLTEVFRKYKSKDFQLVGISIDKEEHDWRSAIHNDSTDEWIQLIDAKSEVADQYYANLIPFNMLLDKEGKIVDTDLKPGELDTLLQELTSD